MTLHKLDHGIERGGDLRIVKIAGGLALSQEVGGKGMSAGRGDQFRTNPVIAGGHGIVVLVA